MNEQAHGRPRVCVVTGGARGIGGAVSRLLGRGGDTVVLNDTGAEAASAASREITDAGGRCVTVLGDITQDAVVAEVAEVALSVGEGHVDVLVNNVGDFRPASRTFLHSTPEQWQRLYELNLRHVLTLTHALLPAMVEHRSGAIVNNSTVEAFRGIPAHAPYSAFNAGVSAFTRSLAVEVGQYGVRVNAVAPDLADTPQTPAAAMLRGAIRNGCGPGHRWEGSALPRSAPRSSLSSPPIRRGTSRGTPFPSTAAPSPPRAGTGARTAGAGPTCPTKPDERLLHDGVESGGRLRAADGAPPAALLVRSKRLVDASSRSRP
nr:SDR family oxidoreductase [Streptomyces xiaopingdaonensis]